MKKIYLHLGFHKTATSSFQLTCEKNIDKLQKQGYYYPLFKPEGTKTKKAMRNHSAPIVSMFGGNPEKYGFNIRSRVKDVKIANESYSQQLMGFLESDQHTFISGEGIGSLNEEEIRSFYELLQAHCDEVVPVMCIRSPYEFHCSSIHTVVKSGRHVNFTKLRSQREKVIKMQKIFGDSGHFIPFKLACGHTFGPVGYLLEQCGVKKDNIDFHIANERRSNASVRLQNALNAHEPSIVDHKYNPAHMQIFETDSQQKRFTLNKHELSEIRKSLDEDNAFFKAYLGEEFCDETFETSEDFTLEALIENYPGLFFNKPNRLRFRLQNSSLFNKMKHIFSAHS